MATRSLNARIGLSVGATPIEMIDGSGNVTAVTLSSSGNLTINTNKFVVTGASGDVNVNAGKLTVTAATGALLSLSTLTGTAHIVTGTLASGATGANTSWHDTNGASITRFRSLGTNPSTQGGFEFSGARSDNTTPTVVLAIDSAGDITIPKTYSTTTGASAPNVYIDAAGKMWRSTIPLPSVTDSYAAAIALG